MPVYDYKCTNPHCEQEGIEYRSMRTADPIGSFTTCPKCNQPTYQRVVSLPHTDLKEFHTPIEMYSIALDDDREIREFKQKCPDVDVSTDPADEMYGIPIARSRRQKLDALKAMGFHERN